MSLSAQDIVALARAGYNAEQISLLNRESSTPSTPSTEVSTPSTPSTPSTESTEESTPSTPQEAPAQPETPAPAPAAQDPAPAAPDPAPTMQDLMSKLAAMETRLQNNAILNDQQPGQQGALTGQDVLARILDPTIE